MGSNQSYIYGVDVFAFASFGLLVEDMKVLSRNFDQLLYSC